MVGSPSSVTMVTMEGEPSLVVTQGGHPTPFPTCTSDNGYWTPNPFPPSAPDSVAKTTTTSTTSTCSGMNIF